MRTWSFVLLGAVLPLLLGAVLGSAEAESGAGTWAYPMPAPAFVALSLGLAVSHALVALAYAAAARSSTGAAARAAVVGGVASLALAACEVWSGALARTPLGTPELGLLEAGYAVSALAVLGGTLVLGAVLKRSRSPLAPPVLLNGLVLLVALAVRYLASDLAGVAALTAWSLTYAWWGLALRRTAAAPRRRAGEVAPLT